MTKPLRGLPELELKAMRISWDSVLRVETDGFGYARNIVMKSGGLILVAGDTALRAKVAKDARDNGVACVERLIPRNFIWSPKAPVQSPSPQDDRAL